MKDFKNTTSFRSKLIVFKNQADIPAFLAVCLVVCSPMATGWRKAHKLDEKPWEIIILKYI